MNKKKIIKDKKINLDTRSILNIIRVCVPLGLTELTYGDLQTRFSPQTSVAPTENKPTEELAAVADLEIEHPVNSQEQIDSDLELELIGLDDPSEYWRRREEGDFNLVGNDTEENDDLGS